MGGYIKELHIDKNILIGDSSRQHDAFTVVESLLKSNEFDLKESPSDCYALNLSVINNNVNIDVLDAAQSVLGVLKIPFSPLRKIMKDYDIICESYHQAIDNALDPSKIEAIDMGRRGLHNEGAEVIQDSVDSKATMDTETARSLFTLLYTIKKRY